MAARIHYYGTSPLGDRQRQYVVCLRRLLESRFNLVVSRIARIQRASNSTSFGTSESGERQVSYTQLPAVIRQSSEPMCGLVADNEPEDI